MEKNQKIVVIIAAVAIAAIVACAAIYANNGDDKPTIDAAVTSIGSYENLYLDISIKDFKKIGATIGDDIRVECGDESFTAILCYDFNGIPSYEAFITFTEGQCCLGYFNCYTLESTDIDVGDVITLSREGRNPYVDKMPNYINGYSEILDDYDSIEDFCNFRALSGGNLVSDSIYRSASPWSSGARTAYTDDLYRTYEIDYLMCLNMDDERAKHFAEGSPDAYVSQMYNEGKVLCRELHPSTHSYPEECKFFIESFLEAEGKIGIFCSLGKDRTGVYCGILEGLAGATYDEVRDDFMLTICNYYGVERGSDEYYVVAEILIDRILYLFEHTEYAAHPEKVDWSKVEYVKYNPEEVFTKYLVDFVGMENETVQKVKDKLTGNI
ncbi:MAG: tyrosine-protein phosphatase [Thermoplasmata archaeon]|nr:tyrosine-protein phosphatase [Thermoplasmata archaeon]MBR6213870.1 tyrosine-protein phosphatase [Candidatus Methanomethylophilaceae archaeon]